MPWVGFEPTVPASERAKTVHALDRSATVTDTRPYSVSILKVSLSKFMEKKTHQFHLTS
jgi:hypothetical protein